MANCPINCVDELIANPEDNCILEVRRKTLSRISFFACSTDLPDPITDEAIAELYEQGQIVISSELANLAFGDPTYEDVPISDCRPNLQILTARELTFEDRVAISIGSPVNGYFDYDFWQDKISKQANLNFILHYCDGDSVIARNEQGGLLTARITGYLNWQVPTTKGNTNIEFKRLSITFNGDPLGFYNKPEFNLYTAGILGS